MTKKITSLVQKNDGGINPKTELFEQPIWLLTLEDGEEKILGKDKMEEYLSKGFDKAIHQFKRWKVTTTQGNDVDVWVVIFTDKTHDLCPTVKIIDKLFTGHSVRDAEKFKKIEEELEKKRDVPQNPALFHGTTITTPEDKEYLEKKRKEIIEQGPISM